MARKFRYLSLALLLVVVAVVLLVLRLFLGPAPKSRPLPNPNGYDDFVKAGGLITGDPGSWSDLGEEQLRQLVMTNSEALDLLRVGLKRESRAPTEAIVTNFTAHMTDLTVFKRLGQMLAAAGRVAELEGRYTDAAGCYVDAIELGNDLCRGGVLITLLVGNAVERIGGAQLVRVLPRLSCDEIRELIQRLDKIDRERETWDEAMQAENRFMRVEARKVRNPLALVAAWWQGRATKRSVKNKHDKVIVQLRLMKLEMALCCYREKHGAAPQRLGQVELANPVPVDPFTQKPIIYRAQGTNWLLYSIGMDGVDDGGKPVTRGSANATGDLFFDSP